LTILRVLPWLVPLSLDTLAVSAVLGTARPAARDRLRVTLVMAGFEMAMPLVGFAAGLSLAPALGGAAELAAAALVIAVGVWMLVADREPSAPTTPDDLPVAALAALGLSVSMDELAVGLAMGLAGLPVIAAVALIGIQAFAAAQIGYRLGARVGERLAETAERFGALALMALGLAMFAARLA
jgi:putative Mn2+ efflux pump MntP